MTRWPKAAALVALLLLTLTPLSTTGVRAQTGTTLFIEAVDADTGEPILDACFTLQDFSNQGCDENGDGRIRFEGIPAGQYVLVQTVDADGYSSTMPLDITVDGDGTQTVQVQLSAQSSGEAVEVLLQPIDVTTGESVTDACFVLQDFSNEGCDENGDGSIRFEGVPTGTYTVVQTVESDDYLPVGDFQIVVNVHNEVQQFTIDMTPVRGDLETVDINVVPYDASTGGGLTDACVIFEGASLEGCDDNGDGKITFEGVPVGTYLLTETVAPAGFEAATSRFVSIQESGRTYYLGHYPVENVQPAEYVDVAIVTRHPETGELLTGACYVILDASLEGCDDNNDGQVDFEDVVPGTYTLHQTVAPDDFDLISDFAVQISQYDTSQSILTKQSDEQYAPGFRNVSVALFDIDTGQRVRGDNFCVVLVDFSNEGCDTNADGQIDFQDVPIGEYTIQATSLPTGYAVYFEDNLIVVEESNPFSIANALLTVQEQ